MGDPVFNFIVAFEVKHQQKDVNQYCILKIHTNYLLGVFLTTFPSTVSDLMVMQRPNQFFSPKFLSNTEQFEYRASKRQYTSFGNRDQF